MYGDQWFKDYKARLKQDVPRDDLYAHKVSPDENVRTKRDQNTAINEYQNQKGTFLDNISPYREPTIDVLRTTNNRNSDVSKVRVSTEENLVSRNLYTKLEDRYPKRLSTYEKLHNNRQKTRYTDLSAYRESTVVEEVKPIRQKTKFTDLSEYRESTCDDNVPFRQKDKFRDLSPCRISTEDNMSDMIDDVKMLDLGAYGESKVVEKVKPIRQKTKFTVENDIPKEKEPYSCEGHRMTSENEGCIRLVLLGKTGSGKSATGNTILGYKQFESRSSGSSVTNCCAISKGALEESHIEIVDTPGFFDTNNPTSETTKEIIRCINLSSPGPHAFLLVLKADRFTEEENDTVVSFLELFGDHMFAFTVVIFTRLDDLEEEGTTIEEYVHGSSDALKRLIKRVNFRYVAFNNRGTIAQRVLYVSSLKSMVCKIQQANGGKHYTSEMYKDAESKIREKIMFAEQSNELLTRKKVKQVETKFSSKLNKAELINHSLLIEMSKQKEHTKIIKAQCQDSKEITVGMLQDLKRKKEYHQNNLHRTVEEERQKLEAKLDASRQHHCISLSSNMLSSIDSSIESQIQNYKNETRAYLRNQKVQLEKQMQNVMSEAQNTVEIRCSEMENELLQEQHYRDEISSNNIQLSDQIEENKRIKKEQQMQLEIDDRIYRLKIDILQTQIDFQSY